MAIDGSTPWTRRSPYTKPGFTEDYKAAQRRCKQLKRRWNQCGTDEAWEDFRQARNYKNNLIKREQRKAFRQLIAQVCKSPAKIWEDIQWARDPTPKQTTVPSLTSPITNTEITDLQGKVDTLLQTFFPLPVQADLDDLTGIECPPAWELGPITRDEVNRAIQRAPASKAPGRDKIPNTILKLLRQDIAPLLHHLSNSSLIRGYYPTKLKESVTIALRKPGKDNYSNPKAYRPIALLNTIGKLMESIIAKRISALAERYHLLPKTHIGGRRLRSTDHAIHYLLERISEIWTHGKVASLLLLDVAGAFDKVSHTRLLANLRARRIDGRIVRWIGSFLSNRTTELQIPEYKTESRPIDIGIPQGSLLSPFLFLFYNAEILEQYEGERGREISVTGFIDNIAILASGRTRRNPAKSCGMPTRTYTSRGREDMGRSLLQLNTSFSTSQEGERSI